MTIPWTAVQTRQHNYAKKYVRLTTLQTKCRIKCTSRQTKWDANKLQDLGSKFAQCRSVIKGGGSRLLLSVHTD